MKSVHLLQIPVLRTAVRTDRIQQPFHTAGESASKQTVQGTFQHSDEGAWSYARGMGIPLVLAIRNIVLEIATVWDVFDITLLNV